LLKNDPPVDQSPPKAKNLRAAAASCDIQRGSAFRSPARQNGGDRQRDRSLASQLAGAWLKTLRKKNASVIFATQSLKDIETSSIASAVVESCPTRLFLPNERALEPQITAIYRRFGLNDRQIELLARAMPKRDYYCQSRRGNRMFEMGLGAVALAFCAASSKTDQAAIAEVPSKDGRDQFAVAWLRHRGLDWAAALITPPAASLEETDLQRSAASP
jgi:type IV secretion system protein TrbE